MLLTNPPPLDKMAAHFKCIFINEKSCILIRISLKFVPKGPTDYINIGSDNGLTPNRVQADAYMRHICSANEEWLKEIRTVFSIKTVFPEMDIRSTCDCFIVKLKRRHIESWPFDIHLRAITGVCSTYQSVNVFDGYAIEITAKHARSN